MAERETLSHLSAMPMAENGTIMAPKEAARRTNSAFSGQNSWYSSPLFQEQCHRNHQNLVR